MTRWGAAGRRRLAAAACGLLIAAPIIARPVSAGPGPGYFASDNVEWITIMPLETDTAGARVIGKYLYITTARWLAIYDLTNPESPQRTGILPMPQQPQFSEEDPDTNGKILLIETLDTLYVVDVEDKSNPTVIAELPGVAEHTISCVLGCKWAYGSSGTIYDLRDPTQPKIAGNWGDGAPAGSAHDVTEVAPGMIVTSTQPIMLLDARKDPAHPKVLATGANDDNRFIHSNSWPRGMKDKFLLVGGETGTGTCDGEDAGAFMVWDATKWKKTKTFTMLDEYRVTAGLPTEGNTIVHTFCTHWWEERPGFHNGGLVAMGWYEHGTRFLEVSPKGEISEAGYFLPVAGSTSAAYWVTDEIVYAVDYQRGIDILRYNDDA